MKEQMTEETLLARLAALPREKHPDNDVWPAIANRIEQQPVAMKESESSNRWWFGAVAASFALLIAAGVLLGPRWNTVRGPAEAVIAPAARGQLIQTSGLAGTLAATELEYQAAFREYISVGEPGDNLSLQTMEKLIAGWGDLRDSETGLNMALQQNPDSMFLNEKMLRLRSRQLEFLKQIAALDRNSRRTMI